MAKDLSHHQQKIVKRYYQHEQTIHSQKLGELVSELWLCEDPAKATRLWGRAQVALMKAGCNATQAASVVAKRDVEALATLVQQVDAGATGGQAASVSKPVARGARSLADGRSIAQAQREQYARSGADSLDEANLKRALKAFRRKLKTLRRDDESRLTGRFTTRGEASSIAAITPPNQFPAVVWQELARQGRLKPSGQGLYELP